MSEFVNSLIQKVADRIPQLKCVDIDPDPQRRFCVYEDLSLPPRHRQKYKTFSMTDLYAIFASDGGNKTIEHISIQTFYRKSDGCLSLPVTIAYFQISYIGTELCSFKLHNNIHSYINNKNNKFNREFFRTLETIIDEESKKPEFQIWDAELSVRSTSWLTNIPSLSIPQAYPEVIQIEDI